MTRDPRMPGGRPGLYRKLRLRHARFSSRYPAISWKRWTLGTLLLITLAAFFIDRPAIGWVRSEPLWLREFAADITDAGKSGWILVSSAIIGIGLHLAGRRPMLRARRLASMRVVHACIFIFFSVAGSGLLANLAKRAIGRARPTMLEELGPFSFHSFAHDYDFESFPSGHGTTDGALAMALALLFPAFRVPFLLTGFLLAITRTLVGAHYPSDVIGGFSFGVWFTLMMAVLFARHGILIKGTVPGHRPG